MQVSNPAHALFLKGEDLMSEITNGWTEEIERLRTENAALTERVRELEAEKEVVEERLRKVLLRLDFAREE